MCEKQIATLKKLSTKPARPIQTVQPNSKSPIPTQPKSGAPNLKGRKHSNTKVSLKELLFLECRKNEFIIW
jgi:hypothetical protein